MTHIEKRNSKNEEEAETATFAEPNVERYWRLGLKDVAVGKKETRPPEKTQLENLFKTRPSTLQSGTKALRLE